MLGDMSVGAEKTNNFRLLDKVKYGMNNFEEYWENFLTRNSKGNKVYDGKKFEKLTEELLTVMYGQKWKSTNTTHDGNKDFYLLKDEELLWAECKNYKDSIALNILAPTLVMAQVCDANLLKYGELW